MARVNSLSGHLVLGKGTEGELLILDEPVGFWGGFDPETGTIVDSRHPQCGAVLTKKIVIMPALRGASSAGSPLAESLRKHTGPLALVLKTNSILAVTAGLVAQALYAVDLTLLVVTDEVYRSLATCRRIAIDGSGGITKVT